jgi:peptide chain release factor 1
VRDILARKLERLTELETLMGDPALVTDQKRFREVNMEYKYLRDLAAVAEPYFAALDGVAEACEMLDSGDEDMADLAREEIAELEAQIPGQEEQLREMLLPRDPDDSRDAIVEVRAGAGGDEAALFAQDVSRMYQRYAFRERGPSGATGAGHGEPGPHSHVDLYGRRVARGGRSRGGDQRCRTAY